MVWKPGHESSQLSESFRLYRTADPIFTNVGPVWKRRHSRTVATLILRTAVTSYSFKLISKLSLTKDTPEEESYAFVRSLLGREPHSVSVSWRIELTDGTVENWPFYN